MESKIPGGYYIKARVIQESDIATAPPYIREIWDWLLRECNHSDLGTIKRGQCVRTFRDIQNGLCWFIGYRKETYKKWQCEKTMKWLRERSMITTTKTTRGMFITIMNYTFYQDPKNYESNNESMARATREQQLTDTINKNDKEGNNEKKKSIVEETPPKKSSPKKFKKPEDVSQEIWDDFVILRKTKKAPITKTAMKTFKSEATKANITLEEAILCSIDSNWQGFNAEWYSNKYKIKTKNPDGLSNIGMKTASNLTEIIIEQRENENG